MIKINQNEFKSNADYQLYNLIVDAFNCKDMPKNQADDILYNKVVNNNLKAELGFNFVHDRMRYFVKAIVDCFNLMMGGNDIHPVCPLRETSCSGRHYMFGVMAFNEFADIIRKHCTKVATVKTSCKGGELVPNNAFVHECNCHKHNVEEVKTQNVENDGFIDVADRFKAYDYKNKNLSSQLKAMEKKAIRYADFHQEIVDLYSSNTYIEPFRVEPNRYDSDRTMIVSLADVHFGLTAYDFTSEVLYSPDLAQNRLREYAQSIIEFADEHNVSEIVLCLLGDLIHGDIHRNSCGELDETCQSPISQVHYLAHNLARFIEVLAHNTAHISLYAVTGNHDRIHSQKDANTEYHNYTAMILDIVQGLISPIDNVDFANQGKSPRKFHGNLDYQRFKVYDYTFEITHGDDGGNTMKQAINSIARTGEVVDYRLIGHYHTEGIQQFGRTKGVVMGSFCSPDMFGKKCGGHEASQTILMLENGKKGYTSQKIVF